MKIKNAILALAVVSLVAIPALGKGQGDLLAPTNLTVNTDSLPTVACDWDDVTGAVKYSVELEALVTYEVEVEQGVFEDVVVEVTVEIGTPTDSSIEFDMGELIEALELAVGLPMDEWESSEAVVKVKGLDPSLPETKRQNNPFATEDLLLVQPG